MRFLAPPLIVAFTLLAGGCSTSAASATDGGSPLAVIDSSPVDTCLSSGPQGAVCKGGGVCGAGFTVEPYYLCAESVEICCAPIGGGSTEAGAPIDSGSTIDATVHDAGHDGGGGTSPETGQGGGGHDAGHDAGQGTEEDAGHDAGQSTAHDAGHDTAEGDDHDAGHDAGQSTAHDAGHDTAPDVSDMKPADGGTDGDHHDMTGDAKAG